MPLVVRVKDDEELWINGELKVTFSRHKGATKVTLEGPPDKYVVKRGKVIRAATLRLDEICNEKLRTF